MMRETQFINLQRGTWAILPKWGQFPFTGRRWRYQVTVNAVPYNAAANACDDWESSLHLFTDVQRNRLSTSITYGLLVKRWGFEQTQT